MKWLGWSVGAGVGILVCKASRSRPSMQQVWRRVAVCGVRCGPALGLNLGPSFNALVRGYHRFRPPSTEQTWYRTRGTGATLQNGPLAPPLLSVGHTIYRRRRRPISLSTPASVQSYSSTDMSPGAALQPAPGATPAAPVTNGKVTSAWVGHHGAAGFDFRSACPPRQETPEAGPTGCPCRCLPAACASVSACL